VVGIYRALIRIGASGQASIDAVAGPVGEALVMTALGLAVAVPAVMQYNWLMRRNKAIGEELGKFSNDLHGYMMSGGQVKPQVAAAAAARPAATGTGTGTGRPTGGTGGPGAGTGTGAGSGAGTGSTTRPTSGGPSISKA
jgi:biopolymer transport protein ExbB